MALHQMKIASITVHIKNIHKLLSKRTLSHSYKDLPLKSVIVSSKCDRLDKTNVSALLCTYLAINA
eukprot:c36377_g1_i1 orf=1-195(-)